MYEHLVINEIDEESGEGEQGESGGQTVDAVDEVDGIADEHHHEDGERNAEITGYLVDAEQSVEIVDVEACKGQQTACENLHGKLGLGIQACQVVDDARDIDE